MSVHLSRDLESLHHDILTMCGMTEELVGRAVHELGRPSTDGAAALAEEDWKIDWYDVQVEEKCLNILALHQPAAMDLRRTIAALKISKELERCADIGVHIAERIGASQSQGPFQVPERLVEMAGIALEMLRRSIDAYVELDATKARAVCERDDAVDQLNRAVISELLERMRGDAAQIESGLGLFSATRHIERIADHATNIAKEVVYMVEGVIIRHQKKFPDRRPGEPAETRFQITPSGRVRNWAGADRICLQGVEIDRLHYVSRCDGRELSLTPTEFRLLWTLMRSPGRPFRRHELLDTARGEDANALERTIDVHIRSLRQKLADKAELVETVRGVGYRFRGDPGY